MGVPVNNTLVRHVVFLAADTLLRVLIIVTHLMPFYMSLCRGGVELSQHFSLVFIYVVNRSGYRS